MRAVGRNPLVRLSDRVGLLLVLLAFVASMIAAPVEEALGTAVYEANSRRYAEQAQTQHTVTATARGQHLDPRQGHYRNARRRADAQSPLDR